MTFDRYPKRQQILVKYDQDFLGMLFTNQITGFLKVEYVRNVPTNEIDFLYA